MRRQRQRTQEDVGRRVKQRGLTEEEIATQLSRQSTVSSLASSHGESTLQRLDLEDTETIEEKEGQDEDTADSENIEAQDEMEEEQNQFFSSESEMDEVLESTGDQNNNDDGNNEVLPLTRSPSPSSSPEIGERRKKRVTTVSLSGSDDETEEVRPSLTPPPPFISEKGISSRKSRENTVDLSDTDSEAAPQAHSISSVRELIESRKDDFRNISNSSFATYKTPNTDYEYLANVLATETKQKQTSIFSQKAYKEKVTGKYKEWKSLGFPLDDIQKSVDEALKNVDKFSTKKTKQPSLLSFFSSSSNANSSVQGGQKVQQKKGDHETLEISSDDYLGKALNLKIEAINDYAGKPFETLSKTVSRDIILFNKNLTDITAMSRAKKREDSKFSKDLKKAEDILADLKKNVEETESYFKGVDKEISRARGFQARTAIQQREEKKIGKKLQDLNALLLKTKEHFPETNKKMTKRIQDLENRANKRKIVDEADLVNKNASKTWASCIEKMEPRITYRGVELTDEEAFLIDNLFATWQEPYLVKENIADALNRPRSEASSLQKIVLDNFPVIKIREVSGVEKLLDARVAMQRPDLVLEMYEKASEFKGAEIKVKTMPVDRKRKKGQGRPEFSYRIKDDVAEHVKHYLGLI